MFYYWINRKCGNYRCLICGFQFFTIESGPPRKHWKRCLRDTLEEAIDILEPPSPDREEREAVAKARAVIAAIA